jgi:hypothetical protein
MLEINGTGFFIIMKYRWRSLGGIKISCSSLAPSGANVIKLFTP